MLQKLREFEEENYWKTQAGIQARLDMLGEDFVYGMQNNALQLLASENEAAVEWVGYIDNVTCNVCDAQIGRVYRVGQFIPELPAHIHCRCSWRLIPKGGV
jgi:hypothetical protein